MIQEMSLIGNLIKAISGGAADQALNTYDTLKQLSSGPNSLSKKAKSGIFEYPFLITNSLSELKDICSIMKSMEVEYGNMLLVSMGLNPTVSPDRNIQIQRTLSNYHTNAADYKMSMESEYRRDFAVESLNYSYRKKKGLSVTTEAIDNIFNNSDRKAPGAIGHVDDRYPGADKFSDVSAQLRIGSEKIAEKYSSMFNSTMITITLRLAETKESDFTIPIGVKGVPHIVRSEDLIYIICSFMKTQKSGTMNRFIRWRSGEINLCNLLFRLDELKKDADFDKRVGTNNSWLRVLKSRGNNRRINLLARIFGKASGKNVQTHEILPNATFVLNLAEIDAIEHETGINLFTNPKAAAKLLDDAMGLGIAIVDDNTSVGHIMFSGYDRYTSMPISAMKSKMDDKGDMTKVMLDIMKKIG